METNLRIFLSYPWLCAMIFRLRFHALMPNYITLHYITLHSPLCPPFRPQSSSQPSQWPRFTSPNPWLSAGRIGCWRRWSTACPNPPASPRPSARVCWLTRAPVFACRHVLAPRAPQPSKPFTPPETTSPGTWNMVIYTCTKWKFVSL